MIKDIHPGFGPEISFEEAIQKLKAWSKAGTEHAFLFNRENESVIRVLSKIVQVHENIIVCTVSPQRYFSASKKQNLFSDQWH